MVRVTEGERENRGRSVTEGVKNRGRFAEVLLVVWSWCQRLDPESRRPRKFGRLCPRSVRCRSTTC